jgi:hypothetical protein
MSGASLPAIEAIIDQRARPRSQRSPRVFASWRSDGWRVFTAACASPPSVALRPRVAARSPMSGAALEGGAGGWVYWRACASLAAGVREAGLERMTALHTCAPIAAIRCDAPARCGALGDERRVVGGDEGGRVYRRARVLGRVVRRRAFRCGTLAGGIEPRPRGRGPASNPVSRVVSFAAVREAGTRTPRCCGDEGGRAEAKRSSRRRAVRSGLTSRFGVMVLAVRASGR